MLVEGQIVGGLAQGLGGALHEELAYDAGGQLLSGTLMDYLLPTIMEMPARLDVRVLEEAPSPLNPLGVRAPARAAARGQAPRSPTPWLMLWRRWGRG